MARKAKPVPRRPRGTGTIRRKRDGFEAEWTHADGSREYRGFPGRPQAAEWLDSLVAKRDDGKDTTAGAQTFETFIKKWLAIKSPKVAPKTAHSYKYYCEIASGQIGKVRIDALTLEHMESLLSYLMRAKFKNLHEVFQVLTQAFTYARAPSLRWMSVNPLEGLELPKVERKIAAVLTKKQRARLWDVAAANDAPRCPLLPLWHIYSRLALRKGEGIALKWTDVNWEEKILTIDESITNIGPDNPSGPTKGRKVRYAPIPDDLLELLRAHRAAQQRRGVYPYVFSDSAGACVTPQHVQYRWGKLRKEAKCPDTTIHALRHTALTLLALDGVPQNVLMSLAGHLSPAISRLYTDHATAEDVRRFVG